MKLFLIFFLVTLAVNGHADSDKCKSMIELNENSKILPVTLPNGDRLSKLHVDCQQWKLSQNIYIASSSEMSHLSKEQWAFEQDQWVISQCDSKGMSTHGWVYEKMYYDKNGELIALIHSAPEMCNDAVVAE